MNPFTVLGLPTDPDLTDEQVRAAWRAIAAATHPDRPDGGNVHPVHRRRERLRPAPHRLGTSRGLRRPDRRSARPRSPTGPPTGRTPCGPAGDGRAAPGPHLARTAPSPCVPRSAHRVAVAGRGEPAAGPAIRSRRSHRPDHVVRADGAGGSGPAAGPVKDDASGGVLRLGDGGHQAMPPHGAGVEGLPVTSPSSRDKPSRPGRPCPGRSSSRALHLDRPGPARTPDGRDDGEVTASHAR